MLNVDYKFNYLHHNEILKVSNLLWNCPIEIIVGDRPESSQQKNIVNNHNWLFHSFDTKIQIQNFGPRVPFNVYTYNICSADKFPINAGNVPVK